MKDKLIPNLLLGGFVLGLVCAFCLGAALRDETVEAQAKETNRQLKRIADSLEIISGQHGTWKVPSK